MNERITTVAQLLGVALVFTGVAWFSVAVACVILGVFLVVVGELR